MNLDEVIYLQITWLPHVYYIYIIHRTNFIIYK